jgi:hypothetical protein
MNRHHALLLHAGIAFDGASICFLPKTVFRFSARSPNSDPEFQENNSNPEILYSSLAMVIMPSGPGHPGLIPPGTRRGQR